MESSTIDVLVVTMGTRGLVLDCLAHLERQTIPHSAYVADNSGNEEGISDAIGAQFPDVRLTTNRDNLGFGNAVLQLAALGDGQVIVLVNDDVNVEPQFLERLVEPLADPAVGMVAGLTLQPADERLVDGFGIEVDPTLMAYNRLRHRKPTDTPGVLLGPSGGAAAYRRRAWEAADGLDPLLRLYGEDLDLALRLRLAGWRAAEAPGAVGVHLGGATAKRDSPVQRRGAGFARGFVLRRYGILRSRHALRALTVELLTVLWGLVRFRTVLPLTSRIAGWRAAARRPRLAVPADAVDDRIGFGETLRRLRHER